jgi:DDE superfamily endonuclease
VKKPPGGELAESDKKFNTAINRIRYVIEQAIANFKIWRILHTDDRRPLSTFRTACNTIRSLIFFSQGFE